MFIWYGFFLFSENFIQGMICIKLYRFVSQPLAVTFFLQYPRISFKISKSANILLCFLLSGAILCKQHILFGSNAGCTEAAYTIFLIRKFFCKLRSTPLNRLNAMFILN